EQYAVQFEGRRGIFLSGTRCFLLQDIGYRQRHCLPHERIRSCRHFIKDQTESVDIGTSILWLVLQLLWSHIRHSLNKKTGHCLHRDGFREVFLLLGHRPDTMAFCQTKIENLDSRTRMAVCYQHNVFGLDVPMDYALGMCHVEGVGDLNAQIEHRFDLLWLASNLVPEGLAFKQFHGDECPPIDLVNLMDRANVRVIERRGRLRLPLKTA